MTTNEFIADMLANGVKQAVIARTLGVSRGRVAGIAWRLRQEAGPGRARARTPDRAVVERIVRETADYLGLRYEDVLGHEGRPTERVLRARRMAMAKITRETGCSGRGLAKVWGVSQRSVNAALKTQLGVYDAPTVARLTWQHGAARTSDILAGRDNATNLDLARWQLLCAKAAA